MVVILYFIAGVLFMKFAKGAQGTELVPNVKFWSTLPFYVKVSAATMLRWVAITEFYSVVAIHAGVTYIVVVWINM